jgi:hypothetical protein
MKTPSALRDEAEAEAYKYFDENIRDLPKNPDGTINTSAPGFHDNDVDAFRHAYVSGVFTKEYSEIAADIFGRLNEFFGPDLYSNSTDPRSLNMDLWNNRVGRKYGKKSKSRGTLLIKLQRALEDGELITDLADRRNYRGARSNPERASKPIVAIKEDKNGRNELFFDIVKKQVFTLAEFLEQIDAGEYPGYVVKDVRGKPTPVSKPDKRRTNNIG